MSNFSNNSDKTRKKYVEKINEIINDEKKSREIEKSIYNHIIKISKEKNIQRSWDNKMFYKLYVSKIMSIYVNLDKDSYIENTKFLERLNSNEIDIKKNR